eukprot:CAMPEP_0196585410 /NCGR_PEP_ID=MMETSP1081-20130531/50520_1 /TAXON_ID=36882 /ORGANISM="Pyramimonas amylifera, Strain CCMP720" /LENGTH=395 /DNA_ID=CAMNT_0041906937 /DNA_START=63 /DNA_END=1250 /DNA_ORIENTATION=+
MDNYHLLSRVQELRIGLNKKASFEKSTAELSKLISAHFDTTSSEIQTSLYDAVCRAATLLKTRYSSNMAGFWRSGETLFASILHFQHADVSLPSDWPSKIQAGMVNAKSALCEQEEPSDERPTNRTADRAGFLFQGQLGAEEEEEAGWRRAGHSDFLNSLLEGLVARQSADREPEVSPVPDPETSSPAAASPRRSAPTTEDPAPSTSTQDESVADEPGGEISSSQEDSGSAVEVHVAGESSIPDILAQAIRNHPNTDVDIAALMEEAMLEMIQAEGDSAPRGAPPAAKSAVAAMAVREVTEEVLQEIGESTQCAVCRDEFLLESKIQVLPCGGKHVLHPECLKPWLDQHNSCPICRFELPTDDMEYEMKKEREANEAEERRGAENAVTEGRFMYL